MIVSSKAQVHINRWLASIRNARVNGIDGVEVSDEFDEMMYGEGDPYDEDFLSSSGLLHIRALRESLEREQSRPPERNEGWNIADKYHVTNEMVTRLLECLGEFFCPECNSALLINYSRTAREYGTGTISLFEGMQEEDCQDSSGDGDTDFSCTDFSCRRCDHELHWNSLVFRIPEVVQQQLTEFFDWIVQESSVSDSEAGHRTLPQVTRMFTAAEASSGERILWSINPGQAQPRTTHPVNPDVHASTAEDFLFARPWTCKSCRMILGGGFDACSSCHTPRY